MDRVVISAPFCLEFVLSIGVTWENFCQNILLCHRVWLPLWLPLVEGVFLMQEYDRMENGFKFSQVGHLYGLKLLYDSVFCVLRRVFFYTIAN